MLTLYPSTLDMHSGWFDIMRHVVIIHLQRRHRTDSKAIPRQ